MLEPYEERHLLPDVQRTQIAKLKPGFRNIHCTFVILDKEPTKQINNGSRVCSLKVADESGSVTLCLWNEAADYFCPGDVCSLKCGSTSVHKGQMSLTTGRNSEILKTGRIVHNLSLIPDMSAYNPELEAKFPPTKNASFSGDSQDDANGNRR